jgi:hypothetical protein
MDQQLNDGIQGNVGRRTNLIQLYSSNPYEGNRLISDLHPDGVPIMVLIDGPSCCYCKLNVPNGITSLEQKWGEHKGIMAPGYYCCYSSKGGIAAMITMNTVRFSAPVTQIHSSYN